MSFRNNHQRRLILTTILLLFVTACSPTASLVTPTPNIPQATASPVPTKRLASNTPSAIPSPSSTATPKNTATPTLEPRVKGLQPKAPWLIVSAQDGLWAANMDGSNLVSLMEKSYPGIDLDQAISPATHQIAVLTSDQDDSRSLALQIIFLPDGGLHKVTDLTTQDIEPDSNAIQAIVKEPSYAWSPDGKKLAFVGALDGPNADVYVYDMSNRKIQKVSQDDGQDFSPSWSPDGKSILYFEADTFGTGAEISIKGMWLAAADGSGSELLESSESAGEQMLGWRDAETAVLISREPDSGISQLRMYNIHSHDQTVLQEGAVFGAAVATGIKDDDGTILYSKDDGLYLLPPGSTESQKLTGDQVSPSDTSPSIRWQRDGLIFIVRFRGGKLSTFTTFTFDGSNGDSARQDAPFNPSNGTLDVSAFGLIWAWTVKNGGSGSAWISGPGLETVRILQKPAALPIWNLDNDLLFFSGHDLYRATFPLYTDAAPVASLSSDVLEAALLGFDEAFHNKYPSSP